jgi:hypothetical protein
MRTGLLVWSCIERQNHGPHDYETVGRIHGPVHCPGIVTTASEIGVPSLDAASDG